MAVTDDHVAAVRAMISEDSEEFQRICQRIERADDWLGFNALLASAFSQAVRRRFREGFTMRDVIQFVAAERVHLDDRENDIDPWLAEQLMLAAVGHAQPEGVDQEAAGFAQSALLIALIQNENLDEAGLDEFLATARTLADSIIKS